MTKQDPDKLCKACEEFDYAMNRRDGASLDVLVLCDHVELEDYYALGCPRVYISIEEVKKIWPDNLQAPRSDDGMD